MQLEHYNQCFFLFWLFFVNLLLLKLKNIFEELNFYTIKFKFCLMIFHPGRVLQRIIILKKMSSSILCNLGIKHRDQIQMPV